MKTKSIPMRMCILTREKMPKKDLIRIVLNENNVKVDLTGKLNGKGCYLKKDVNVVLEARKKKILNHVFEKDVPDEVYDEIINNI